MIKWPFLRKKMFSFRDYLKSFMRAIFSGMGVIGKNGKNYLIFKLPHLCPFVLILLFSEKVIHVPSCPRICPDIYEIIAGQLKGWKFCF